MTLRVRRPSRYAELRTLRVGRQLPSVPVWQLPPLITGRSTPSPRMDDPPVINIRRRAVYRLVPVITAYAMVRHGGLVLGTRRQLTNRRVSFNDPHPPATSAEPQFRDRSSTAGVNYRATSAAVRVPITFAAV